MDEKTETDFHVTQLRLCRRIDRILRDSKNTNLLKLCYEDLEKLSEIAHSSSDSQITVKVNQLRGKIQEVERSVLMGKREDLEGDVYVPLIDSIEAQNKTLLKSVNQMRETEATAMGVTENLLQNRESILRSSRRTGSAFSMLEQSQSLLNRMRSREKRKKYILTFVFVALAVTLLMVIKRMVS